MKRRVMIAKALAHEPRILFLDEPTAGVDVELRREMWDVVRELRESGVTIILTTHYIEEAEMMADRVGVINKGEIVLVEEKADLMRKLGRKELTLQLQHAAYRDSRGARRPQPRAHRGRRCAGLRLRHAEASGPASPRSSPTSPPPASASATFRPARPRSRTSSSTW